MAARPPSKDPMESQVADALAAAGIHYRPADEMAEALDFYLPAFGVFIEVKQFHSARIAG